MTDELDLARREFLAEAREGLDLVEVELLALERDPGARPRVDAAFRALHTLKGTAGFLGLRRVEALAHEGEELLALARAGERSLRGEPAAALLELVDALRRALAAVEAGQTDERVDARATLERVAAARRGDGAPPRPAGDVADDVAGGGAPGRDAGETSVRVDVAVMDRLMNLTGELVLVRNQLLRLSAVTGAGPLVGAAQRLDQVTSELQDVVMRTRLQPIGGVWGKLRRTVRDLAASLGKQVRLDVDGAETELDRALVEAVRGPLTHLVRNAVDHGIEPPDVRRARGKPAEGRLTLRARHEGGKVVIEVQDDGAGVDVHRLVERAVQAGQLTADEAARLSERERLALALRPGLSTAPAVTPVSGRGVGMDAVKAAVERIGGAVALESVPSRGTTVRLEIPLTLAIVPALLVASRSGQRFAVPQAHVVEVVRAEGGPGAAVERVLDAPVLRLRGRLLALVRLEDELDPARGRVRPDDGAGVVVVLEADGRQVGLVVAEVHDTQEIVVKPLGKLLAGHPLFAGATVLGDGGVALILDVPGLVARAHERGGQARLAEGRAAARPTAPEEPAAPATALLVVEACDERAAIPLDAVARLEELPRSAIERALGREVVQYRGRVVPLVSLRSALGLAGEGAPPDPIPVVMVDGPDGVVGLAVDRIVDVLERAAVAPAPDGARRRGVAATAVVARRVTQVLDTSELLAAARERVGP